MSDYIPIPVEVAGQIGERYGKSIVIISAWDPEHGVLHTTTWGHDPQSKEWSAQGGEITAKALLRSMPAIGSVFQDYRLEQARKLLVAIKSMRQMISEAFYQWQQEWLHDHGRESNLEVGNLLTHLAHPLKSGYRPEIDAIHKTIAEAERFIRTGTP